LAERAGGVGIELQPVELWEGAPVDDEDDPSAAPPTVDDTE
jgi:hypothetical protein